MVSEPLLTLPVADWHPAGPAEPAWIEAVEAGRVLYFPQLAFRLDLAEQALLAPQLLAEGARNISLDAAGVLKGVAGPQATQQVVAGLVGRFAENARALVDRLFPHYSAHLREAPTSLRPTQVSVRKQSMARGRPPAACRRFPEPAEPRRAHPAGVQQHQPRRSAARLARGRTVRGRWRGASCRRPSRYSAWQAALLHKLRVTKSLRSEYDHLMLQLHDRMKADVDYQREGEQARHRVPGGQHLDLLFRPDLACRDGGPAHAGADVSPARRTSNTPEASPLAILTRLAGRPLAGAAVPASEA